MSMYAEYLREKTDDEIVETEIGFASYRFLNEKQVYIIDLYVRPDRRLCGAASTIADSICKLAREKGCSELVGTVVASAKNSDASMKTLLSYGMKPTGIEGGMVVFKKDI